MFPPRVSPRFAEATPVMVSCYNRHDFGVSWNDVVDRGGVVVSDMVDATIGAEAVLEPASTVDPDHPWASPTVPT